MKPRVLMLPKWYPHRYDDQDGDFVARHVEAIASHAQVAVLFATVARGPLSRLVEYEFDTTTTPTLRYYYCSRLTGLKPLDKLLKLLLYFGCLGHGYQQLLRRWGQPQLVHVHVLLRTGLFAWWLKTRYRIPYLITEHWTLYLPINAHRIGRLRQWLTQRVVAAAAALHTVSENLRQSLAALSIINTRAVVIPNVVDTELFTPMTSASPVVPRSGLLHVAAFNEPAKNLSGLLRTMARLAPLHPGLTLRIAGYGPYEATLRQLATDLRLMNGTVLFLGKLPPAAVAAEMRRAACLILFSNYENLPCVLIEAQAAGLPAVATHVGGVPELLPADDSRGLLVAPGDEAALQQALEQVLAQPTRFDPHALRNYAVTHFSYAAVGQQFAGLYARALGCAPDSVAS